MVVLTVADCFNGVASDLSVHSIVASFTSKALIKLATPAGAPERPRCVLSILAATP